MSQDIFQWNVLKEYKKDKYSFIVIKITRSKKTFK